MPIPFLKFTFGKNFRQCFYSGIAMISVLIIGMVVSWTAPMQLKLQDEMQSPLDRPVTDSEMSWIGSLVYVSAPLGPIYSSFISDKVGRKSGFIAGTLMFVLGQSLLLHPVNVAMLYAGRLMAGAGSGLLPIMVTYVTEITTEEIRGHITSSFQAATVFGQLLQYSITPFLSYTAASYANFAVCLTYIVLILFLPESPVFYILKGHDKGAIKSLKKLRGYSIDEADEEHQKLQEKVLLNSKEDKVKLSDLWSRHVYLKHFLVIFALITGQQLSGYVVLTFYLTSIFKAAGSSIDANYASLIVIGVQFGVSIIVPLIMKRYKRKTVLVSSLVTLTLMMSGIAVYFQLLGLDHPAISSLGFLPLVLVIVFIMGYSLGLGPIPWMLVPELIPIHLIPIASTLLTIEQVLMGFLSSLLFNTLVNSIGPHGTFGLCASITLVTLVIVLLFLPETKGKTIEELCDE